MIASTDIPEDLGIICSGSGSANISYLEQWSNKILLIKMKTTYVPR